MHIIIAFVGMTGAGKSTAAECLVSAGWTYIRFGQVTIDRLKAAGKDITPENERVMRETLRREHGMGVFALLSLPAIEEGLRTNHVVIDGLYSWAEYKILKARFGDRMHVVAVYAPPKTRYRRLAGRAHDAARDPHHRMRPLTPEQAQQRDAAEIENLEKGGPIAMADHTIINESTVDALIAQVRVYAERVAG
jgi:dephospho-CoA kinase